MRKKSVPTRYPGVYRVLDEKNSYRLRGKVKDPKTGRTIGLDKIVEASSDKEASRKHSELLADLARSSTPKERTRFRVYATSWLRLKLPTLKPATRAHYAEVLDNHILPACVCEISEHGEKPCSTPLGEHYLDAITTDDLARWRNTMLEQGARPATVNSRLRILKAVLREAVDELDLPRDPTRRLAALPEVRAEDDPNCLTAAELYRVLEASAQHTPRWYAMFYTLAFTGMRFGEVTALKWSDVDEAAGTIRIARGQWKGRVGTTKTGVVRTVPLSSELLGVLQAHRHAMLKEQHPGFSEGWMFPADKGGLMHNTAPRRALAKCLRAAGVKTRFTIHGFRRTFNNLMRQVTAGEVVRAMTGHSTVAMTEHYSHVGGDEKRAAIASLVQLVAGVAK